MAFDPSSCGGMVGGHSAETPFKNQEIDRPLALCALFQGQLEDNLNDGKEFDEYVPIAYQTQVVAGTNYTIRIKTGPNSEIGMEAFWPLGSGLPTLKKSYPWGKKDVVTVSATVITKK
ncbi:cystatin-A-like [Branchiostoma floridae x Branchiostoma japonicum]